MEILPDSLLEIVDIEILYMIYPIVNEALLRF